MDEIRGWYAPVVGNSIKVCIKDGKRYVPVCKTMLLLNKFLDLGGGISTGVFIISNPAQFVKSFTSKGIGIAIISWDDKGLPHARIIDGDPSAVTPGEENNVEPFKDAELILTPPSTI